MLAFEQSYPAPVASSTFDFTPGELFGPLNTVEQKFAPVRLFLRGNLDLLKQGRESPSSDLAMRRTTHKGARER